MLQLRPSFLIIGAQKCGTTSLYNYLAQHPLIIPAKNKEIHYFDINFDQDINWYLSHFHLLSSSEQKGQFFITGEATPYYVFHPLVAKRVFNLFPDIKIILLLRNPIERAYYHYKHEKELGYETLSFEQAIEKEEERLKGETDKIINTEKYYSFNHQHYSYLSRGLYLEEIQLWLKYFDLKNFLILSFEELIINPSKIYTEVLTFLNLPKWKNKDYLKYHTGLTSEEMKMNTRKELMNYFKIPNKLLNEYLNKDFNW